MSESGIETLLAQQINGAPPLLRSYIQELERQADPAVTLRELIYAREEKRMLGAAILELKLAIRTQPNTQGADRCRS